MICRMARLDEATWVRSALRRLRRRFGNGRGGETAPETAQADTWLDDLVQIGNQVSAEDRARLPRDGARNFDYYLDGSPRQE